MLTFINFGTVTLGGDARFNGTFVAWLRYSSFTCLRDIINQTQEGCLFGFDVWAKGIFVVMNIYTKGEQIIKDGYF
jgi:hypothetical protein